MQPPDLKIADAIRSILRESLGAIAYEMIAFHIKSSAGIDFSRPETVVANIKALEDYLQRTFRDSASMLMDKAGNNLLAAFSLPDRNFQYCKVGDLSRLVEKIIRRSNSITILSNAQDKDHFVMSYASKEEELPSTLVAFLQRGFQNKCLNLLILSEYEKRLFESFLASYKKTHGKGSMAVGGQDDNNNIVILTHDELFGNLDSLSSSSFPLSPQPILNILNQARQTAIERQLSGLNVVGTVAGTLFSKGKFAECLQLEKLWHEIILQFSMPITVMCPYEKPIDDLNRAPLISCHSGGLHQIQ